MEEFCTLGNSSWLIFINVAIPQGHRNYAQLSYKVVDSSGHSSNYRADLICENNPTDQASRWSSPTNDQNQFLLLQLPLPALVATITFGKYHKGR